MQVGVSLATLGALGSGLELATLGNLSQQSGVPVHSASAAGHATPRAASDRLRVAVAAVHSAAGTTPLATPIRAVGTPTSGRALALGATSAGRVATSAAAGVSDTRGVVVPVFVGRSVADGLAACRAGALGVPTRHGSGAGSARAAGAAASTLRIRVSDAHGDGLSAGALASWLRLAATSAMVRVHLELVANVRAVPVAPAGGVASGRTYVSPVRTVGTDGRCEATAVGGGWGIRTLASGAKGVSLNLALTNPLRLAVSGGRERTDAAALTVPIGVHLSGASTRPAARGLASAPVVVAPSSAAGVAAGHGPAIPGRLPDQSTGATSAPGAPAATSESGTPAAAPTTPGSPTSTPEQASGSSTAGSAFGVGPSSVAQDAQSTAAVVASDYGADPEG